jgi:hypothetical protein
MPAHGIWPCFWARYGLTKIEMEKGLVRWAQSSYWLDDLYTTVPDGQLPGTWRLGTSKLDPNARSGGKEYPDDTIRARHVG